MDHGMYDSWYIESIYKAYKHCDKSFFFYNETGIPQEIRGFWDAEFMTEGQKREITIVYNNVNYIAHIIYSHNRTKLRWQKNLAEQLSMHFDVDDYPVVSFAKKEKDTYILGIHI